MGTYGHADSPWGNRGGGEGREAAFAGEETVDRREQTSGDSGAAEARRSSSRGSAVHALIEFLRRLRLEEGVARKGRFIEKDGSGVVGFP